MKLKEILKQSADRLRKAGIDTPITDSQIIIAKVLKIPRWKLITDRERDIELEAVKCIEELIQKRAKGIPVAYIVGSKEFFGIKLFVNNKVLIPRPETEILVEETLKKLLTNKKLTGLDIGVGSGAISIALLKNRENLEMVGVDISEEAIKVAERNAKLKNVSNRLQLIKSNIFSSIPKEIKFDFIVSNPPYIPIEEYKTLSKEVKTEPKIALISGKNGLAFYERIIKNSKKYLKKGGFLAFEVGHNQSYNVKSLLEKNNYKNIEIKKDLNGIDRVVIAYLV